MTGEETVKKSYEAFRGHVREAFYFKVRFKLICESEYERTKAEWAQRLHYDPKSLKQGDLDADTNQEASGLDSHIMALLLEMDEKIDQLIARMNGKEDTQDVFEEAVGLEISGGGMKIRMEKPLVPGQLIRATLLLSRIPFVRVQILGKVIHVKPRLCGETPYYDAGVHFLELDSEEREKIIGCVFQRQREGLRRRKNKDMGDKQVEENDERADMP